jgi:hypothetical protein
MALVVALASCAPEEAEPLRARCEPGFEVPAGFEPLETFEEPYPDHLGVRQGYRDGQGRELHVFAGIPGEFGEGLARAGELPLAGGGAGELVGQRRVWVLVWDEGDRCDPRAVLGNGLGRRAFVDALRTAGVLSP